jgi:hypothetical protein
MTERDANRPSGGARRHGSASPAMALAQAADALTPPLRLAPAVRADAVRLTDPTGRLPDVGLSLRRDQRLFSRTFLLVVSCEVPGPGPGQDGTAVLDKGWWRRRGRLRWQPRSADAGTWCERLAEAGLLEGIARMTSVQQLAVEWSAAAGTWRLRLETLAGALIGISPSSAVAVPIERADVEGLTQVLEAFRAAVGPGCR